LLKYILTTKFRQRQPGSDDGSQSIYGGSDALPQRLPWQVYLNGPFGCGGTLVSMKVSKYLKALQEF